MKIALRNYNLEFQKNDKKVILQFIKQALKQTEGSSDLQMIKHSKLLKSITAKMNESSEVKFTKDEYFALKNLIVTNAQHLKKQIKSAGFIKRFFLKSLEKQYSNIVTNYFQDK